MDGPEQDEALSQQRPAARRRHGRLRTFIFSSSSSTPTRSNEDDQRSSRLHLPQMPSLLRRLTSRRSSTAPRPHHGAIDGPAQDVAAAPSRRSLSFANLSRSSNPRFSYIHQETVTTISERQEQELADSSNVAYTSLDQDEDIDEPEAASRSRRRRLSLQMSNFFTNITSPGNRRGMHFPNEFCSLRPFSPTNYAAPSRHMRTRTRPLSAHDPTIAELDDFEFRPPTPAEVRLGSSQENMDEGNESEYERGFTPRRRRLRPQPVVGEPHDEDYVRRRVESDRRARRATWGPTNNFSFRDSSLESLQATSRPQPVELPTPSTSSSSFDPRPSNLRTPSLFSRAFSNPTNSELPEPAHMPISREPRALQSMSNLSLFRPAHALRQLAANRRAVSRSDTIPSNTIPLAELQRLLQSYAAQSSDRDYNGHQETTVDGGTITIYGIRRVSARPSSDGEDGGLFPPPTPPDSASEERPPLSRDRPRGPRRIFNFIGPGLSEIDPLPPEFEETFERLRRTRRPRSMFGSGSLRRNGVVEPDVPNTTEASTQTNEETSQTPESDETWIFYIVSAVLPEGHPLLSAPSLFTDNPTYEDMLFLDSFLQKPVASRNDVANARGLYRIHRRSNGNLYASGQEQVEDTIEITTERCLICLSDFEENEEARMLVKCTHFFHKECIDTWLTEGRNSCPLCRGEGVEKKRSSRHISAGPSTASPSSSNVL